MNHSLCCCASINNLHAAVLCNWDSGDPQGTQIMKLSTDVVLLFSLWLLVQLAKRLYTWVLWNKVEKKGASCWNYKQMWLGKMWIVKHEKFTLMYSWKKHHRMFNEQMIRTSVLHLVQSRAPLEAKNCLPPQAGHQFTFRRKSAIHWITDFQALSQANLTWLQGQKSAEIAAVW